MAAELIDVDADTLQEPVAGWVRRLTRELAPELSRLSESEDEAAEQRVGLQFLLGATASDSRRRDPLMPYRTPANEGLSDRAWWSWAGGLWLETYNVAAETRLFNDRWFYETHGDPDGRNPGGYKFLGRTDNAYLTLAYPWGNIWVGRFKRNWGPIGQTGMMIGANPTSYPQIGLDLGRGSLTFRFMAGELESVNGRQRYIVGNRASVPLFGPPMNPSHLPVCVGNGLIHRPRDREPRPAGLPRAGGSHWERGRRGARS